MTSQNFGPSVRSSEIYGLTFVYAASDPLVIDGYAGLGQEDFAPFDTNVVGLAANHDIGNRWAADNDLAL